MRTVRQVLEWVDGDRERALLAIDVEFERPTSRSTLLGALERIASGDTE